MPFDKTMMTLSLCSTQWYRSARCSEQVDDGTFLGLMYISAMRVHMRYACARAAHGVAHLCVRYMAYTATKSNTPPNRRTASASVDFGGAVGNKMYNVMQGINWDCPSRAPNSGRAYADSPDLSTTVQRIRPEIVIITASFNGWR